MSDGVVLDSGVLLRWYVEQAGFEHAREVQDAVLARRLHAMLPDQGRIEFAAVLRTKGVLAGRLRRGDYLQALRDVALHGVDVRMTSEEALVRAPDIAIDANVSLYDAVFVELALSSGAPLLTNDVRLARAVGGLVSTELLRGVSPTA
jgi:predicted nucleic acid-binding protein